VTQQTAFAHGDGSGTQAAPPTFAQPTGGGVFPKPVDIVGELVMLTPVKIEQVPGYEGKGFVDRLTADTVVLTGSRRGEYPEMWWNQETIVKNAKSILRQASQGGQITPILGRLVRFPQKNNRDKYPTPEAIEAALANWRPGQPDVKFAWGLSRFSDEDAQIATAWINGDRSAAYPATPAQAAPAGAPSYGTSPQQAPATPTPVADPFA
jgi:hypothetical protein